MDKVMNINDVMKSAELSLKSEYNNPLFYLNRELSWLEFNKRVLHQASRQEVPLIERLKFLGITSSNLDEFIMVRLSSILNKIRYRPMTTDIAGLTPDSEYNRVFKGIMEFKKLQDNMYHKLRKKMSNAGHKITSISKLSEAEYKQVEKIFNSEIYQLLTPISVDSTKEFPLIKSRQLTIVVGLTDNKHPNLNVISFIPITGLKRLYEIKSDTEDRKYLLLEDIVTEFLHHIFINKTVTYHGCIRIVREADIELELGSDVHIVDRMRQTVYRREHSEPIFMDVSNTIPKHELKVLCKILDIDRRNVYRWSNIIDFSFFIGTPIKDMNYEYEPFEAQYPVELIGEHDMFTAIDGGDILLHHPYESFSPVIKFLEHAASDKNTLAIKQTLYRVSSAESPIVEALCKAARNGKSVSVLLEIKARFDEERNMSLIDKLNNAGCLISYGDEELKTHCKFIAVVRKSKKGVKTYCHIGTGNYNDKTSSVYTDLSYFTSNAKIGQDLLTVFNVLSGFSDPQNKVQKILYAPYNIRTRLYDMIDREVKHAKSGKEAFIILKLNSLSDKGLISRLYKASEQGVKIMILARGICSMRPLNNNITIKSVIGRYLEHSRIYYFHNAGKMDLFISSADLLTRNLDRRVEIMVPITGHETRNKLFTTLQTYFEDSFNTYLMDRKGKYSLLSKSYDMNVHEHFMELATENYRLRRTPKMLPKQKPRA